MILSPTIRRKNTPIYNLLLHPGALLPVQVSPVAYPAEAAGSITLQSLMDDVLANLDETQDSPIAQYDVGDGTILPLRASTEQIRLFIADGVRDLTMGLDGGPAAIPVLGMGTASVLPGQRNIPLQSITCSVPALLLWQPRSVAFAGVALRPADRRYMDLFFPHMITDVTVLPRYWSCDGTSITLAGQPGAAGVLSVEGYIVPSLPVSPALGIQGITDAAAPLLVWYACMRVAIKNADISGMTERIPLWRAMYAEGKAALSKSLGFSLVPGSR